MNEPKQLRDADKTRSAILSASTQLFAEKGFIGASISDIAELVGLSKSSIYHHFPSKEAIFLALVDSFAVDIGLLNKAARKHKFDQEAVITELAEIMLKHKAVLRLAPMLMPGAPPEIRALIIKQQKTVVKLLISGVPTKEKLMRAMLAVMGIIMSIAPPPGAPSGPVFRPDVKLIVKIALDTLGVRQSSNGND